MKTIESERLSIQPLRHGDALEIIRIHSLPEVSRYQGWVPDSEQEIRSFIDRMATHEFLAPDQWFQFSIAKKEERRLIGDCGVHAGAEDRRQVEIGVTLDPAFQKQGYAQEAVHAVLDFIFHETDTHRVYASIDPRNEASIRLFEKLGFRKEAHLVQSLWFKGEWADDLIMAILKEEWAIPNMGKAVGSDL
jgi:RimJ/RimL family protein N-acetyltransferase